MHLSTLDIVFFIAFVMVVMGFAIFMSRRKKADSADYFLASRGAVWPLIGFSLLAANISTEQIVGQSGAGAGNAGLAVASYEWIAAITLVFVAIFFLPRFLRAGIFTIPEYLEYRYNTAARLIMSVFLLIMFVFVTTVAVVYSGGVAISTFFHEIFVDQWGFTDAGALKIGIWIIGIVAVIYTATGGLKAVLWADLVQGIALILGCSVVMFAALRAAGGWNAAMAIPEVEAKMHMVLPGDHPVLPWTILIVGIWIPNFYYWGLNQYITQRTLAAKTLREGQLGVIFAAALKLLIPFIVIIPGILAPVLFADKLGIGEGQAAADQAYPILIRELITDGWRGFVLAALAGAVISSLASMLNSASTLFTMDLYKRILSPKAEQSTLVWLGRGTTVLFAIIACLLGPFIGDPKFGGVFTFIQEFQGMFSPGILAAFVFGFIFKRAPAAAAITAMVACPILYGGMKWLPEIYLTRVAGLELSIINELGESVAVTAAVAMEALTDPGMVTRFMGYFHDMAFLNRMAITFGLVLLIMWAITAVAPLSKPVVMPVSEDFDMKPSRSVYTAGTAVILATVVLYIIFW